MVEAADGIEEEVVDTVEEVLPELPVVEKLSHIILLLKSLAILNEKFPFLRSTYPLKYLWQKER